MPAASASAKTARLTGGSSVAATARKVAGQVAGVVGALVEVDLAGGGEVEDAGVGVGRDDGDVGAGGEERLDLGLGEVAGADDDGWPGGEFEEDGEEGHGGFLLMVHRRRVPSPSVLRG